MAADIKSEWVAALRRNLQLGGMAMPSGVCTTLALWFKKRVDGAPGLRKTMVVALARKLLIALWRMATKSGRSRKVSYCVRRHEPSRMREGKMIVPAAAS